VAETKVLDFVENRGNAVELVVRDEILHQIRHALVGDLFVEVGKIIRENGIEEQAADCRLEYFALELRVLFAISRKNSDFCAQIDRAEVEGGDRSVGRLKRGALAFLARY